MEQMTHDQAWLYWMQRKFSGKYGNFSFIDTNGRRFACCMFDDCTHYASGNFKTYVDGIVV